MVLWIDDIQPRNGYRAPVYEMIKIRIDERLKELGKTWYWLALETHIGHSAAFNLRHGKVQSVKLDYLERICRALECSPGDLLVIEEQAPQPIRSPRKRR
jgi:putative transcriptional regulator